MKAPEAQPNCNVRTTSFHGGRSLGFGVTSMRIGLVGKPNVGKSTAFSALTETPVEIANYPFTTLTPNLGIVKYSEHKSNVIADIPG